MDYEFFAPREIVFGWGRRRELADRAAALARRVFVVWGSRTLRQSSVGKELLEQLAARCVVVELGQISAEPAVADVDRWAAKICEYEPATSDAVLGIGGGSAVDMAKALAAMATNLIGSSVADYLEGAKPVLPLSTPPLPVIAVPTTAGTGSEATKNAVISIESPPGKKSLRSESLIPRLVLVDPELTVSVPPAITVQTGMDAITQLIESYVSRRARPLPQALVLGTLRKAIECLPVAARDGQNRPAREVMSQAALVSGIALANSGLGLAHGVAAALSAHCGLAHGLACALMLPIALRTNLLVAEPRLAELAAAIGIVGGTPAERATAFVEHVERLCDELGVPRRLSECGVTREQIPLLVAGSRGNSMSGNPRQLEDSELQTLLEAHW